MVGVLQARGRTDEAIAFLDESLGKVPKSTSLRLLKLALLEQKGDAEGVIAMFRELTELEPDNANYRLALANFYQQKNDPGAAEGVLREAIQSGVRTPQATSALIGLVYRQKGFAAAESELKQLIAQTPERRAAQAAPGRSVHPGEADRAGRGHAAGDRQGPTATAMPATTPAPAWPSCGSPRTIQPVP